MVEFSFAFVAACRDVEPPDGRRRAGERQLDANGHWALSLARDRGMGPGLLDRVERMDTLVDQRLSLELPRFRGR
jgi:hypothetical protein